MIDLKHFRENPESYKKACIDKRIKFDVDAFLELDSNYRKLNEQAEELSNKRNVLNKKLGKSSDAEREEILAELKKISSVIDGLGELGEIKKKWQELQLFLPSLPSEEAPIGKDDSENVEISKWSEPKKYDFKIKDHVELGKNLGLFDIERGVKIAGARNYFLTGIGAMLHHAVLNMAIDFVTKRGFKLMDTPHIVNYLAMEGTGYFPGGEEMSYHLDSRDDNSYLIGTSEVALVSFHSKESFKDSELPKKYAGYSPCYRREAGSYGKDTKGLYRVHQFYKVEQVIICRPDIEVSSMHHAELLKNAEDLMQALELPYRVVKVCTGDMGQGQVFKHDIETWMPSREAYGETHSCSTMYDFQARRSQIRYKGEQAKGKFCHTLNNTLIASPRVLIPLIENHQQKDGSLKVPKALQPYLGGREIIS